MKEGANMNQRELIYKDDARRAVLKENPSVAFCIDRIKAVDAVELPKGKQGDYILWDTGVGVRLMAIKAIAIYQDGIRYVLADMCPVVNHHNILKILSREEVEAELAKMVGDWNG